MLDTGCWILDTGYWILDTGCWMLDAGSSHEIHRHGEDENVTRHVKRENNKSQNHPEQRGEGMESHEPVYGSAEIDDSGDKSQYERLFVAGVMNSY